MHSKISEHAVLLRKAKADLAKAQGALDTLKAEVVKSLTGESAFSPTLLNGLIADAEANLCSSADVYAAAQAECDDEAATLAQIEREYSTLVGWAEMYDAASVEAKKMIVAYLVERVDVFRGYRIHVRFTIDLKQFGIEHEVETERTIQC